MLLLQAAGSIRDPSVQGSAYQQMRGLLLGATGSDRQPHSPKIVSSWFLSSPCSHLPDRHCHVMQHSLPSLHLPAGSAPRTKPGAHHHSASSSLFFSFFFPFKPSEIEFCLQRKLNWSVWKQILHAVGMRLPTGSSRLLLYKHTEPPPLPLNPFSYPSRNT